MSCGHTTFRLLSTWHSICECRATRHLTFDVEPQDIKMSSNTTFGIRMSNHTTFECRATRHSNVEPHDLRHSNIEPHDVRHSITKTCLYNVDPLKPHFYIVKLGFTGVYINFLIFAQNIDCRHSLEQPRWGGSNEYQQYVLSKNMKKIRYFIWKFSFFLW